MLWMTTGAGKAGGTASQAFKLWAMWGGNAALFLLQGIARDTVIGQGLV